MFKLLHLFVAVAAFVSLSLYTVNAVDLCDRGYKTYSKEYLFLIDSYASIAPRFFLDDEPFHVAGIGRSSVVPFPGPQRMRFRKDVSSARECAKACCDWKTCSMMVYEATRKSCVLVYCDDELIEGGTCAPKLDAQNTKMFTIQNLDAAVVTKNTQTTTTAPTQSNTTKSDADDDDDDPLNMVDAVREPERYVTIYLRLRSSLLKGYLDELRTVSNLFPLDEFSNSDNTSVVAAIQSKLAAEDWVPAETKSSFEGVLTQPCVLDKDCELHEECYISKRSPSSRPKKHRDEKAKHRAKRGGHARGRYDSDEDYSDDSEISETRMQSIMSSLEEDYENVDVDNDAGFCVCSYGFMRVNASATATGICIVDPNPPPRWSHPRSNSSNQNVIVVVDEEADRMLLGLLAIDMEGAGVIYLMIIVVICLLFLLTVTWLCVLCKVRIAVCIRSCCDRMSGRGNRGDTALLNSRAGSSAGAKRAEYRALLSDETAADAQNDLDLDEDVSFDRSALTRQAEPNRGRHRDTDKKK